MLFLNLNENEIFLNCAFDKYLLIEYFFRSGQKFSLIYSITWLYESKVDDIYNAIVSIFENLTINKIKNIIKENYIEIKGSRKMELNKKSCN